MSPRSPLGSALASPVASALVATLTTLLVVGLLGAAKGNRRIVELLEQIDAKLDATHPPEAPDPVFALEVCIKGALAGEGGFAGEHSLRVEGEGRVGAEAYGNGLMAKLRAIPGAKIEGGAKGEVGGELSACFDLRALAASLRTRGAAPGISPETAEIVQRLAAVDRDRLLEALASFVDATQLDPAAFPTALDRIRTLPSALEPGALAEGQLVAALGEVLPLPAQHRTRLLEPDAILTRLEQDGALCELQGLPPALADVVDRACTAAANEPLKQALLGAEARIGNLQSRVNTVANQVAALPQNVVNALCNVIPGC
jgi:hypothetical protein